MAIFAVYSVSGQNIFTMSDFSTQDLNGTARYVSMGGAMSALGADLSTMSTNPAATGLYRKSDIATTMSVVSFDEGQKFDGKGKTYLSFDNIGLIYAAKISDDNPIRFFNIGFNYKKSKDFNQLINVGRDMSPYEYPSQTWQMADLADAFIGENIDVWKKFQYAPTPLTNMGYWNKLIGYDDKEYYYNGYGATDYKYDKAQRGSLQEYDFNFSTNINDRVYLGVTVGAYNVDFRSYSLYRENLCDASYTPDGYYTLSNNREITGSGYDFKFGIIARPIEESNFRIGVGFSTPTYYSLTHRTYSVLKENTISHAEDRLEAETVDIDYDYKIRTPWKFNFSIGNTFFNSLAVGLEYELSDLSATKLSYGSSYDIWDYSDDDIELNREANRKLCTQHTFKAGLEWMVDKNVYLRAGYNFVSSPHEKNAYYNQFIDSASLDYCTSTNYMTLSNTNRYTVGLGFNVDGFYMDLACLYQNQHGTFYPFNTQMGYDDEPNDCPGTRINLNKTQVMLTLGYRF